MVGVAGRATIGLLLAPALCSFTHCRPCSINVHAVRRRRLANRLVDDWQEVGWFWRSCFGALSVLLLISWYYGGLRVNFGSRVACQARRPGACRLSLASNANMAACAARHDDQQSFRRACSLPENIAWPTAGALMPVACRKPDLRQVGFLPPGSVWRAQKTAASVVWAIAGEPSWNGRRWLFR